jgi:hypothetical protein
MSAPTAIRATFSQYAMVKTRGVLVLHMEVPLEQQAEVFKVLGYPLPGEEVWCGIARLQPIPRAGAEPADSIDRRAGGRPVDAPAAPSNGRTAGSIPATGANHFLATERGKARYASASDMERARTRAALLPKDARFQRWAIEHGADVSIISGASDGEAAAIYIRDTCCASESRRLIAEDETCYRAFIAMETQYLVDTNQMAEPR